MKHSIKGVKLWWFVGALWMGWSCTPTTTEIPKSQMVAFVDMYRHRADSFLEAAAQALEKNDSLGLVFVSRDMESMALQALDTLKRFSAQSDSSGYLRYATQHFETVGFVGGRLFRSYLDLFQPEMPESRVLSIGKMNDSLVDVWEKESRILDSLQPIFLQPSVQPK
jgi:hypothetical protein